MLYGTFIHLGKSTIEFVPKGNRMNSFVGKIRWSNYTLKLFFFKDNLIVVLKSLFTRIYWCFVINYRFKIVQIVTLGPMNWPLDQYLTFGPMTSIPDLWTNGVTLEPKAWPSEQWPVVSTDSGSVGKAQISTLCFRF